MARAKVVYLPNLVSIAASSWKTCKLSSDLSSTRFGPMFPFYPPPPQKKKKDTSENLWFSDVFRGYKKGALAWNGLKKGWK